MRRIRELFSRKAVRGQTLVLFALMSLTLIAGMGLVIDAGVNYAQRRNMQNAADTAALAGTRIVSRVNTYPGTTRGMVWSAVKQSAIANGVVNDATLIQCVFVDASGNSTDISCNTDVDGGANLGVPKLPTEAAGVQVRVSETHNTFFLRAVGIRTSGTSAASKAQIRVMAFMPTNDVVFAVCGVETKTSLGAKSSILLTEVVEDWTQPRPSPPASPIPKVIATKGDTAIDDRAYKFDWNIRDAFGNMQPDPDGTPAPTYQIYSPDIADCDILPGSGPWTGVIEQDDRKDIQMQPDGSESRAPRVTVKRGAIGTTNLKHAINGTLGCKVGQLPAPLPSSVTEPRLANLATDGCVMLLPILDNGNEGWSQNAAQPDDLRGRVWGVFYVFNTNGRYYGWLIKNYPVHEDGENTWKQRYTGPITIALTKVD